MPHLRPDRRSLLLMAAALPATAHAQGFNHIGPRPALPRVSEALDAVMRETKVPALGYAAVGPKGIIALDAAGRRRSDVDDYVTIDDPWHIGSNTKAMTAALYARLVEQGRASWGATLPGLFPDVSGAEPAWASVKIEDLLAHRSGISDDGLIDRSWLIRAHADTRPVLVQRAEFAQRLLTHPPTGKFGEFEYANSNYILAGAAIERLYKDSWEVAIGAELFAPLGMGSAGFGPPTGAAPWGHEPGPNGLIPVDPLHEVADNPPVFGPAGRVHVNLADYAKFARVFLTGGGGWLSPGSLAKLARPWDGKEGYALGWQYYPSRGWADGPVLAHEGSNTLWRVMALIAPARPLAYLIVTNCGGDGGQQAVQLLAARLIAQQVDPEDTAPPTGT